MAGERHGMCELVLNHRPTRSCLFTDTFNIHLPVFLARHRLRFKKPRKSHLLLPTIELVTSELRNRLCISNTELSSDKIV
jgi:hypothetical protein